MAIVQNLDHSMVEEFLKANDYHYTIDSDGDFRVEFAYDEDLDEGTGKQRRLSLGGVERLRHFDHHRYHARQGIDLSGRTRDMPHPDVLAAGKIGMHTGGDPIRLAGLAS